MSGSVNNSSGWGQWSSDLNESTTLIQQINQNIPNMDNATTYAQFMAAYQSCYSEVEGAANLGNNPYFNQFVSGLQVALSQTIDQVREMNPDLATYLLASVVTNANGSISATMQGSQNWLENNTSSTWLLNPNQTGTDSATGDTETLGTLLSFMSMFDTTVTDNFTFSLPNGDPVTLNIQWNNNGTFTITVNASEQDLASQIELLPDPNVAQPMQNFMKSW